MLISGLRQPDNEGGVEHLETFMKFRQHVELIFKGALADNLILWVGKKECEIYSPTLTNNKNQRTIGPENAHLKPDLGV